jgi:hypothetical protein
LAIVHQIAQMIGQVMIARLSLCFSQMPKPADIRPTAIPAAAMKRLGHIEFVGVVIEDNFFTNGDWENGNQSLAHDGGVWFAGMIHESPMISVVPVFAAD